MLAPVVASIIVWLMSTARRLDRLHIRLDRSRDALQAAFDRRCAVIAAIIPSLVPLARTVEEVRLSPRDLHSRLAAEDELGLRMSELRAQGADSALTEAALCELQDADKRVMLALRFYNDAVADTRSLRLRPAVRGLRLAGTAAMPEYAVLRQLPAQPA